MARLARGVAVGSEPRTARAAQSTNRPSIRIAGGMEAKYAASPSPATVTVRGACADWSETWTGVPAERPEALTDTVTDADRTACVRVTCAGDGDAVTPAVEPRTNGPTVHESCGPGSPTAATSSRRAAVVPEGRTERRGTWRIRIAPWVAATAMPARAEDPSKSSEATRIVVAVGEKDAKRSVSTRSSRGAPEAAACPPPIAVRRLQFSSEFAGNSYRRPEATCPDPPYLRDVVRAEAAGPVAGGRGGG